MEEEMELVASNVTSVDKKGLERLHKITFFKNGMMSILISTLSIVLIGAIYSIMLDLYWGIGIMVFGILFGVLYPVIYKILLDKNANNKLIREKRLVNRYDFYENHFEVQTKSLDDPSGQAIGFSRLEYREVTKVLIDDEYLFIFINKNQCFIVRVSGMLDGTIADVKMKLRQFCPNIIIKKSKKDKEVA